MLFFLCFSFRCCHLDVLWSQSPICAVVTVQFVIVDLKQCFSNVLPLQQLQTWLLNRGYPYFRSRPGAITTLIKISKKKRKSKNILLDDYLVISGFTNLQKYSFDKSLLHHDMFLNILMIFEHSNEIIIAF